MSWVGLPSHVSGEPNERITLSPDNFANVVVYLLIFASFVQLESCLRNSRVLDVKSLTLDDPKFEFHS